MAKSAVKKNPTEEEFVLMGRTRALLGEVWDLWRSNVEHSPQIVKSMMNEGMKEMRRIEAETMKEQKALGKRAATKVTKSAKKIVKKAVKKANATSKKKR